MFNTAFVTTSRLSSRIAACAAKQKAAATGSSFIMPGIGISSDT